MSEGGTVETTRWQNMKWKWRERIGKYDMRFWEWLIDFALDHHPLQRGRESNYLKHAERELRLAGWYEEDAFYDDMMPKAIMRQLKVFGIEGHSGMSAGIASRMVGKLSMFQPLSPLTDDEDEWMHINDEERDGKKVKLWQNRRKSDVFAYGKKGQGNGKMEFDRVYWLHGRIFREPDGMTYTGKGSSVDIELPWMPTEPEYVDVEKDVDTD